MWPLRWRRQPGKLFRPLSQPCVALILLRDSAWRLCDTGGAVWRYQPGCRSHTVRLYQPEEEDNNIDWIYNLSPPQSGDTLNRLLFINPYLKVSPCNFLESAWRRTELKIGSRNAIFEDQSGFVCVLYFRFCWGKFTRYQLYIHVQLVSVLWYWHVYYWSGIILVISGINTGTGTGISIGTDTQYFKLKSSESGTLQFRIQNSWYM